MPARPEVIVSLATYPPRLRSLAQCLQPLLRQTVQPDAVVVNLATEDFGGAADASRLPDEVCELESEGYIQLGWREHNLKSHNKYWWVMREHPDAIVILVDDDLIYDTSLVARLLDMHYRFPDAVIGERTHKPLKGDAGLLPYTKWPKDQMEFTGVPRLDLMVTSGAGSLYPPHILPPQTFDEETMLRLAPTADDVWLYFWEQAAGVERVSTGHPWLTYLPETQEQGLFHQNVDDGGNDDYLGRLADAYPEVMAKIVECTTLAPEYEKPMAAESKVANATRAIVPERLRRIIPHGIRKAGLDALERHANTRR